VGIDGLPKPKKAEVDQAVTLVKSLQRDFDATNYEDEHRKRLLAIIEKKRKGQEIEIPEEPEAPKAVPDLMAALEASIQRMKTGGREALAAEAAADGTIRPRSSGCRRRISSRARRKRTSRAARRCRRTSWSKR
jgi:DNA end-binding protein Ku